MSIPLEMLNIISHRNQRHHRLRNNRWHQFQLKQQISFPVQQQCSMTNPNMLWIHLQILVLWIPKHWSLQYNSRPNRRSDYIYIFFLSLIEWYPHVICNFEQDEFLWYFCFCTIIILTRNETNTWEKKTPLVYLFSLRCFLIRLDISSIDSRIPSPVMAQAGCRYHLCFPCKSFIPSLSMISEGFIASRIK